MMLIRIDRCKRRMKSFVQHPPKTHRHRDDDEESRRSGYGYTKRRIYSSNERLQVWRHAGENPPGSFLAPQLR